MDGVNVQIYKIDIGKLIFVNMYLMQSNAQKTLVEDRPHCRHPIINLAKMSNDFAFLCVSVTSFYKHYVEV